MREQNCRNARQPANAHRRVLGAIAWFSKFVFRPRFYAKSLILLMSASVCVSFLFADKIVIKLKIIEYNSTNRLLTL